MKLSSIVKDIAALAGVDPDSVDVSGLDVNGMQFRPGIQTTAESFARTAVSAIHRVQESRLTMAFIPLKTVGGLNAREHWRSRAARVSKERSYAKLLVPNHPLPCVVTMTRLSPGRLDDDNLQGACKAIRDGVADKLGIDDRDPRVQWRYVQRKCKRGEYGVEVEITPA